MPAHLETRYNLLRTAILRRQCLTAKYDRYIRRFAPHALGSDYEAHPVVLAFQYGGGCAGGLPIVGEWICFRINELCALDYADDGWKSGPPAQAPRRAIAKLDVLRSRALLQTWLNDKRQEAVKSVGAVTCAERDNL